MLDVCKCVIKTASIQNENIYENIRGVYCIELCQFMSSMSFMCPALTHRNLDHVRHLRRILPTVDLLAVNRHIPRGVFLFSYDYYYVID